MKTLITVMSICIINVVSAQKFQAYVDKFTGKKTYFTEIVKLYSKIGTFGNASDNIDITFMKSNDSLYIVLFIRLGGNFVFQINEGQSLFIKQLAGNIIDIKAASSQQSIINRSEAIQANLMTQAYYIDNITLTTLKNSGIQALRFEHTSGNYDFDIKEKYSGVLNKIFRK